MTMSFTRRTFLQSSLMAGLASAADATCTRWLLCPNDAVRIGIAGLGACAFEHLALFAAVPGARIVGLADPDPARIIAAQRKLRELNQPVAAVYRNLDHMLTGRGMEAVAVPNEPGNSAAIFHDIVKAGLPIFSDFPPAETHSSFETSWTGYAPAHFRLTDFTYPATPNDLTGWMKRSKCTCGEAYLLTSPGITVRELYKATIVATSALLVASPAPQENLMSWVHSQHAQPFVRATTAFVPLPETPAGIRALHVNLLARSAKNSKLVIQHRMGSMEVAIASRPNVYSSLRNVMMFLDSVRKPPSASRISSSYVRLASLLVEETFNSTHQSSART